MTIRTGKERSGPHQVVTHTEDANAAQAVASQATFRADLDACVRAILEEIDTKLAGIDEDKPEELVKAQRLAHEEYARKITAEAPEIRKKIDGEAAVSWAADKIVELEREKKRIDAIADAFKARAERRLATANAILWPAIEMYALANPPKTGKTIKLGDTLVVLQWRANKGNARVYDKKSAMECLESRHGFDEMQDRGVFVVKTEINEPALRDLMLERAKAAGGKVAAVPGVDLTMPGDKLTLVRRSE